MSSKHLSEATGKGSRNRAAESSRQEAPGEECLPGLRRDEIRLETLGITYTSARFGFRDDGIVEDINEHTREVFERHLGDPDDPRIDALMAEMDPAAVGRYLQLFDADRTTFVMFCRAGNRTNETFRRAHEETHVLHHSGEIWRLEVALREKGVRINLSRYEDYDSCTDAECELVANVGALYAVSELGIDVAKIPPGGNVPDVEEALAAYKQGLLKGNKSAAKSKE